MKLNLGCGNQLLDGYTNIDIADIPGVVRLDVRNLPYEDSSVDEIITVHMIEHIWPWEIKGYITEWYRVLKPDGRLIVECPNIDAAAKMLLFGNQCGAIPAIQAAMNAFYGDPQDVKIEERHKWGYTPATLSQLLRDCGFSNVKRGVAEYKMKELRDMRIIGCK